MALDCYPVGGPRTPCPTTVDDWVKAICASLPPGFAFEAAETPGTLLNGRVRAVAHLLQIFNEKACSLLPEFNCDTAGQTLDDWNADFGIPDPCDINVLCLKVTAQGEGTCESLQELADAIALGYGPLDQYGIDLCCNALPPELQAGCWDLGQDQMAPQWEFEYGGSELGFSFLGLCPPTDDGCDLGQDILGDDCNIVGYISAGGVDETIEPACEMDGCFQWEPSGRGTLLVGCARPIELKNYVGTAYHLLVGVQGSSAILLNPEWAEMGCFEMGCSELCTPPIAQMLCYIERHRHAHVKVVPVYC